MPSFLFAALRWGALLLVLVVMPVRAQDAAPTVQATDGDARALFERGSERYARGEYAEAKQLFEAAYHLSKRPQLLYNIALVDDHLRNEDAALQSYRAYLEALPEAKNADEVRARIRVLEQTRAPAVAPVVATPEEAARAALPAEREHDPVEPQPGRPLVRRWWFWTAAAVVLSGAAVAVVLATRDPGSEKPLPGDNGLVVHALEVQP